MCCSTFGASRPPTSCCRAQSITVERWTRSSTDRHRWTRSSTDRHRWMLLAVTGVPLQQEQFAQQLKQRAWCGVRRQNSVQSDVRQAVHQPARLPVIPLTGLVLNLCPALMNEPIPALRYEVTGHSDESQSYCGGLGSSRSCKAEASGRPGRPVSDEVMVDAEEANRTNWPLTELS
ncbi:unnamed protein product [Pleuronectes platessa]|uniref:Uncharacterized protein n=1 Tax=Pleuronectes platessa TaxID=8262 RepID=A0A9N7VYR0_PLEPL|nr:unnamed protein product [Pleuronectes platessa]